VNVVVVGVIRTFHGNSEIELSQTDVLVNVAGRVQPAEDQLTRGITETLKLHFTSLRREKNNHSKNQVKFVNLIVTLSTVQLELTITDLNIMKLLTITDLNIMKLLTITDLNIMKLLIVTDSLELTKIILKKRTHFSITEFSIHPNLSLSVVHVYSFNIFLYCNSTSIYPFLNTVYLLI